MVAAVAAPRPRPAEHGPGAVSAAAARAATVGGGMEQESPDVLSQEPTPSPAAPADFTDWVARRLPPLEHAARQLTGDDTQAATLARELLGLVAMRWSRLRGNDAEHHAPPGAAADRLLQRLFAREVADAVPQHRVRLDLDRTPPARRGRVLPATVEEEAAALWRRGRATTRRRLLIAGAVGAVALGAAGIRALAAGREEGRQPLSALPTGPAALDGVDEVPPVARQLALPVALVAKLPRSSPPATRRGCPP
ncbi:hypothetical protein ACFQZ4_22535 [Catellatospora coxensis]